LGPLTLTEATLFRRTPGIVAWAAGFPIIAMIILASIPAARHPQAVYHGATIVQTYLPIIIGFALVMTGVNFMPATIVGYREKGVLRRLSTTPVAPGALLGAQLIITACVQLVVTIVVVLTASIAGSGAPKQWFGFVLAVIFAAAACNAVGMGVSAVCWTAKAANVVGTVLFFVLMFFSGLWYPRVEMPSWLRGISDATPMGSGVQLLQSTASGHWPSALFFIVPIAYGIAGVVIAIRVFRWE
jgi:ABC-2 type transport system permease protein